MDRFVFFLAVQLIMPSFVTPVGDERDLTLDMVHQYTFCPRRFHLMYVEGRWDDNAHTVEGRHVHRRVDRIDHLLPGIDGAETDAPAAVPVGDEPPVVSRSVSLTSAELGLVAKLDLVSTDAAPEDGGSPEAVPVETKKARVPSTFEQTHETHRVQLMAQGLLLREHGYRSDHGVVYFAGSRARVEVPFTPQLESLTQAIITRTREAAGRTELPLPLIKSPKCEGCSLNGICLPDETHTLSTLADCGMAEPADAATKAPGGLPDVRRLFPARETSRPLYVQEQGAYVLVLCGNIGISAATVHLLTEAQVPIVYLSSGHWFYGITQGMGLRNAYDRAEQFRAADNPQRCLDFARQLIADKAANQRTLIRRNAASGPPLNSALRDIDDLLPKISAAPSLATLLGLEGNAARAYFSCFGSMLKPRDFSSKWDFNARNRRPPKDPVNALLSFGYAMLAKECTVALLAEGLDPYWGFYHQPRHGRPALALDLMEPFRPLIVDSAVITAVNTGMVKGRNFKTAASGCVMQPAGRKGFIRAYEARLDQLVTHPLFDYRCSWRSVIKLQARLLSRWLRRDIPAYKNIVTR